MTLPAAAIRSTVDVGIAKSRRRASAAPTPVECSVLLTRAQVATFREFFTETLEAGSLPFEWVDPASGSTVEMRFVAPPRLTPRAPRQAAQAEYWSAALQLEIIPAAADTTVPAAPTPAGGGAGVRGFGSQGDSDLDDGIVSADAIAGYIPLEADDPPPEFTLETLSGFGSRGFDLDEPAETLQPDAIVQELIRDSGIIGGE